MVDSQQLGDAECRQALPRIARAIENNLTYPGEVKVTVLARNANHRIRRVKSSELRRWNSRYAHK